MVGPGQKKLGNTALSDPSFRNEEAETSVWQLLIYLSSLSLGTKTFLFKKVLRPVKTKYLQT